MPTYQTTSGKHVFCVALPTQQTKTTSTQVFCAAMPTYWTTTGKHAFFAALPT